MCFHADPDDEVFTTGGVMRLAAHESQVGDFGPFLAIPAEQLEAAFGQESFRPSHGCHRPTRFGGTRD